MKMFSPHPGWLRMGGPWEKNYVMQNLPLKTKINNFFVCVYKNMKLKFKKKNCFLEVLSPNVVKTAVKLCYFLQIFKGKSQLGD